MALIKIVTSLLAMASAETEYSFVLPQGVGKLTFRLREGDADLKFYLSSTSGQPTGDNYYTLGAGSAITIPGALIGQTLYFQCATVSRNVEFLYVQPANS